MLIKMRDDSFELLEKSGERTKVEKQIENTKSTEYLLYQTGSWATFTLMRLARQI